jgi:hypothetical protein
MVCPDPSYEEMSQVVAVKKLRPVISDHWEDNEVAFKSV